MPIAHDEFIEVISPKHGKQIVLVDKDIYYKCLDSGLYVHKIGQFLYVRIKPTKQYLHRFVMNPPKNKVVDHINRDTLDNRRSNLRICTIQQNLQNQKRTNNKTGHTGVAIYKLGKGGFSAQIKINYKKIHLGVFRTIKEAFKVRKQAEKKYFK